MNDINPTANDMPLGFGMALSQNRASMEYFSGLSQQQQNAILEKTKQIKSKKEMRSFVDKLNEYGM